MEYSAAADKKNKFPETNLFIFQFSSYFCVALKKWSRSSAG